jgi:uncharacterized protein
MMRLKATTVHFTFHAHGHPAVSSTHRTTLELTTESRLTKNGDCIVAVGSSASLGDLPTAMRYALSRGNCRVRLTLRLDSHSFNVDGYGSPGLTFSHPTDIVVRRSSYASDRTLMIRANRSAADIPRALLRLLRDPDQKILVDLITEIPSLAEPSHL